MSVVDVSCGEPGLLLFLNLREQLVVGVPDEALADQVGAVLRQCRLEVLPRV